MNLLILHYHLRPGGIRRVIELAVPHLLARLPIRKVILACGEAADQDWNRRFASNLAPVPVDFVVEPSFLYVSDQRRTIKAMVSRLRATLKRLFDAAADAPALVWFHNPGVGRNLLLVRETLGACQRRGIPFLAHHHDWWFDNRWLRWREIQRCGFRSPSAVARVILSGAPGVRHITISRHDLALLRKHLPGRCAWLPNPARVSRRPASEPSTATRRWLKRCPGLPDAPLWVVPCRVLRRKNIAEALLITRWLRPEAHLMVTGGASSSDEVPYSRRLTETARKHRWPLRLGLLETPEPDRPEVAEVLAASEVVLLTSIQEGFGLPFLEAAATRRPLIARTIPNVAPDLEQFGFRFPLAYREILVDSRLFDEEAERQRQARLFNVWRNQMPRVCRVQSEPPIGLSHGGEPHAIPFSRLTLTAQLEVLRQPIEHSWSLCAPLNPFLARWRAKAARAALPITRWPGHADRWLSGAAYASTFELILALTRSPERSGDPVRAQQEFIRAKLKQDNLFPLLWDRLT
ncbi:MAG TPA: glycosyltransferase [Methylomirabilota bacterium]|nr:glycosyltransferase [Methylomirabilota bacterium]